MNELFKLTGVKKTYLGFQPSFDDAKVVVVPVPYDATTSYGAGTRYGPSAIIDASSQLELYDIELEKNICDQLPIYTLDELSINKGSPEKTIETVKQAVKHIKALGKKPVVLGGEHSITSGAIAGLEQKVSVLQIDAHADLRESYQGTKYSHASVMRRVRGMSDDVVQVGIRSMCDEEAEFVKENKIELFYADDLIQNKQNGRISQSDIEKIVSGLTDNVYVTVDVDGFDPSLVPGTGTPEPGGLLWHDVLDIMKAVSSKNVVGFDMVEVLPSPPFRNSEFLAAKLAYKMMGYFWST
ncbi:MAG: agmatinase [Candidatus Micrarchaeota archaeon]|nr:agmatinase [Candidatus Micrarchaeota archaeon]